MWNSDSRRLLEWPEICACPSAASDSGIKRHLGAIFRSLELALGNNRYDLCEYFDGLSFLLLPLPPSFTDIYPLYPILHIVRISRIGMKTCTSNKPDLLFLSSPHRQCWWVFEILVAEIYIMLGCLNVTVRVRQISNLNCDLNLPIEANLFSPSSAI